MVFLIALLLIELLLWLCAFALSQKDILAPSVMMCNMFIISTVFALINVDNWEVNYQVETFLIISTGITVFLAGVLFSHFLFQNVHISVSHYKSDINTNNDDSQIQTWKLVILVCIGIVSIIWYFFEIRRIVGAYGYNVLNVFASYRIITTYILANRSDSTIQMTSFLLNQLVRLTYSAGYAAAYILIKYRVRKNSQTQKPRKINVILLRCILVLSIVPGFMGAERNQFLQLLVAIMVFYYVLWHQEHGWARDISWKFIRIGLVGVVVGIPVFYQLLRLVGRSTALSAFESGSVYIGSSIPLLNMYIENPAQPPRVFGEESLLGIHQFLKNIGVDTYVKNRHLEFRHLNSYTESNIYTFFRRPLHDFGLVGMYIFVVLIAIFFGWFYYGKIKNKRQTKSLDYWTIMYGYFFYWIVYSSIDQRSISYIATTPIMNIAAMLIVYWILVSKKARMAVRLR